MCLRHLIFCFIILEPEGQRRKHLDIYLKCRDSPPGTKEYQELSLLRTIAIECQVLEGKNGDLEFPCLLVIVA